MSDVGECPNFSWVKVCDSWSSSAQNEHVSVKREPTGCFLFFIFMKLLLRGPKRVGLPWQHVPVHSELICRRSGLEHHLSALNTVRIYQNSTVNPQTPSCLARELECAAELLKCWTGPANLTWPNIAWVNSWSPVNMRIFLDWSGKRAAPWSRK